MKKGFLLVLLFTIFVIIAGLLFIPDFYAGSQNSGPINARATENGPTDEGDTGKIDSEKTDESESPGFLKTEDCHPEQISYAVKNLIVEEECLEFDQVCRKKKVSCSFDVYNLDYGVSGLFGFNLHLDAGETIDSLYLESFIEPRGIEILYGEFEVMGENAGKELTCVYAKDIIPKKEVCE